MLFSLSFPSPLVFQWNATKKYRIGGLSSARHFSKVFSEVFSPLSYRCCLNNIERGLHAHVLLVRSIADDLLWLEIHLKEANKEGRKRRREREKRESHSSGTSWEEEWGSPQTNISPVRVVVTMMVIVMMKKPISSCFLPSTVIFFMQTFSSSSLVAYDAVSTEWSTCGCCRLNSR